MRVHAHTPVGDIAAALPPTTKLFDIFNIDYVCHGNLSLRDACAEAGVDPAEVRKAIEVLPHRGEKGWADAPMRDLLVELRDRRHPKLHAAMRRVATLLSAAYEPDAQAVLAVRTAFMALYDEIDPHMRHEERVLFPLIDHIEECWTRNRQVSTRFSVAQAMLEHGEILEKVRRLMSAAELLKGQTKLRAEIDALAHELREHMHLENNLLYPRASALEAAVTSL